VEGAKFETLFVTPCPYKSIPNRLNNIKSLGMGSCYHPNLKKLTNDDVKRFTLKGIERYAKVLSVYDGDTCDLLFYQDDEMVKYIRYKCRMSGYDAPELDETPNGKLARNYLVHLCTGGEPTKSAEFLDPNNAWTKEDLQRKLDSSKRLVYAEFGREGKYGRPLAILYQTSSRGNPPDRVENTSINDLMKQFIDELDRNNQDSSESSNEDDVEIF
jgi:endonuclease YncB( thermonuclease family)